MAADSLRGPGLLPEPCRTLQVAASGSDEWRRTNVRPQRQAGFAVATLTVPLGDLTAAQMELLADLSLAFGDGTARTTSEQNLLLRWVTVDAVQDLHARLATAGLAQPGAEGL